MGRPRGMVIGEGRERLLVGRPANETERKKGLRNSVRKSSRQGAMKEMKELEREGGGGGGRGAKIANRKRKWGNRKRERC